MSKAVKYWRAKKNVNLITGYYDNGVDEFKHIEHSVVSISITSLRQKQTHNLNSLL